MIGITVTFDVPQLDELTAALHTVANLMTLQLQAHADARQAAIAPRMAPAPTAPPEPNPQRPAEPSATTPEETKSTRRSNTWTVARMELLRQAYVRGDSINTIMIHLNELPGRKIVTKKAITEAASKTGLKRPAHDLPQPAAPLPPVVFAAPSVVASPPSGVAPLADTMPQNGGKTLPSMIAVTYATAYKWAGERGLACVRNGMEIGRVNRKRVELGLPQFHIQPAGR